MHAPVVSAARVGRGAASVDLGEDRIVGVLHANLDAGAAVATEAHQLFRVDGVGPRLQSEPDDLRPRALVEPLLLLEREPLPSSAAHA